MIITPDLKGIAEGKKANVPEGVSLKWVEDVKAKLALQFRPTKKNFSEKDEWAVVLAGIEFTDGVIEVDLLGKSDPPQGDLDSPSPPWQ